VIAVLFASSKGTYADLPNIELWDEIRDARKYPGPHPIVAHPPCQRWGKFFAGQPLYIKRTGIRKIKGDDGGCFNAALSSLLTYGGVLEHPEHSHAWAHFGLTKPLRSGGWSHTGVAGLYTCCVEQGRYGHYANKPTWLLSYNTDLPELRWGKTPTVLDPEIVARMGYKRAQRLGQVAGKGGGVDSAARIGTPPDFRDMLLSIARTVKG